MGEPEGFRPAIGRPKRRWKLWHLLALVAVSGLVMALGVRAPAALVILGLILLGIGPPIGATWAWDRWANPSPDRDQVRPKGLERFCINASLLALFLEIYWVMLLFVIAILMTFY